MLRLHTIEVIYVALSMCVLAVRASADTDTVEGRPPPEIAKIAFTVGVWDTTVKYRFTPDAPVFNGKSVETVQWSTNRQFLISDQRSFMPTGWMNKLVITTWDPAKKEYKLVDVMPDGEVTEVTMTVDGNRRSMLYYRPFEGRLIRTEIIAEYGSQTEYTFRCECTDQGKTWFFCEGTSRKRPENASNQAMQLTASKPDVHAWSVCRRQRMLRFMHTGLAAADLVSR